jgi:ribosomal protein S18 acetylase RimI-like enzyme
VSTLTVTRATPEQAPLVGALLNDAVGWLAERGIDQWPDPFPEDIVLASVGRRDTHLAWLDGEPVGTLALYWSDTTFWGIWRTRPADAGYVHRLAVATRARGQGLGSRLLDWAESQVAARGRDWLRLDCGRDNRSIRSFYEGLGFRHVEDVEVEVPGAGSGADPWRASLYQRAVRISGDQSRMVPGSTK